MAVGTRPPGRPEPTPLGDPVGRLLAAKYRVVRRIGGGALADVYEAVHEQLGGRMAVKILRREFARFPDVSRRFLVEARAASTVSHPGIIQVFDIGQLETGELFMVMELLQGEDLGARLMRQGRFDVPGAVHIAFQLLEALDAAHRAGVIHRDLKPENVLLVPGSGGREWVKIIDFGIARLAREGPTALRGTAEGSVLGSPYYMSPEQARGLPDIDLRTDLYAVGVLLYEMLTGELPYTGLSITGIVERVLSEPFPSPRELIPAIPPALERVILTATARDRNERYHSASALAEALRPFRSAEDAAGQPPPPAPVPADVCEPEPPAAPAPPAVAVVVPTRVYVIAVAAAVVAAVIAVVVVSLLRRDTADTADGPAAVPRDAVADVAESRAPEASAEPAAEAGGIVVDAERESVADVALPPADAGAADATPDLAEPDQTPVASRCTVRLLGLPPGARVTFDGRTVVPPFEVEPSSAPRLLEVAARGWKTYREPVRVMQDTELVVRLERRDGASSPDGGSAPVPDAGAVPEAGALPEAASAADAGAGGPPEASPRDVTTRPDVGFAPNPFGG
jgi:serine/threonine-protein kinase